MKLRFKPLLIQEHPTRSGNLPTHPLVFPVSTLCHIGVLFVRLLAISMTFYRCLMVGGDCSLPTFLGKAPGRIVHGTGP